MAAYYINGAGPSNPAFTASGNGSNKKRRPYRPRWRQFTRFGERGAVLRAFLAARAYRNEWFETLAEAAINAGSNVSYVRAALVLMAYNNEVLTAKVMRGEVSIRSAAAEVEPFIQMRHWYCRASLAMCKAFETAIGSFDDLGEHILASTPEERIGAARDVGTDVIWDSMVVPAMPAE